MIVAIHQTDPAHPGGRPHCQERTAGGHRGREIRDENGRQERWWRNNTSSERKWPLSLSFLTQRAGRITGRTLAHSVPKFEANLEVSNMAFPLMATGGCIQ